MSQLLLADSFSFCCSCI